MCPSNTRIKRYCMQLSFSVYDTCESSAVNFRLLSTEDSSFVTLVITLIK